MTAQEAIAAIKMATAEVEWEYPMEYAAAFDEAVKALELVDSLKAQIRSAKLNLKSENVDYLTGCLSALSAVEGMIAEKENEQNDDEELKGF